MESITVENLPVKRIVLFKNGVAYFERSGPTEGVFEFDDKNESDDEIHNQHHQRY